MANRFFEIVDKYGEARNDEPYFEDGLKEIQRSHDLSVCLKDSHVA